MFQEGHAKVHLGPLKCQPKQNQYDIKEHLKSVEKKIEDSSDEQDSKLDRIEERLNTTYVEKEEFHSLEVKFDAS